MAGVADVDPGEVTRLDGSRGSLFSVRLSGRQEPRIPPGLPKLILIVAVIIGGLFLCLWITRLVLRELAKGWALDDKRRGPNWDRGEESLSRPGSRDRDARDWGRRG